MLAWIHEGHLFDELVFIQILRPNHPEFAAERKLTCQQLDIKTRTFYDAKMFDSAGLHGG